MSDSAQHVAAVGGDGTPPLGTPQYREAMLREELRALRVSILQTMQWGVTVLVGLQTALFFVRQDVLQHYLKLNKEAADSGTGLPFPMHLIGTGFLLMIAVIAQQTTRTLALRYVDYQRQLGAMNRPSGITELAPNMAMKWFSRGLFYAFPVFDVLLRVYIGHFHFM